MKHAFKMCLFCSARWSSGRTKTTRWKRTSAQTWKRTTSAIMWRMMTVKSGSSTTSTGLVIWMHLLIRLNCCSSKPPGNTYAVLKLSQKFDHRPWPLIRFLRHCLVFSDAFVGAGIKVGERAWKSRSQALRFWHLAFPGLKERCFARERTSHAGKIVLAYPRKRNVFDILLLSLTC